MTWDGHLLLLYGAERERLSKFAAWARHGLECGEKVVYSELSPTAAREALWRGGVDVSKEMAVGRLVELTPEEFYPAGGQIEIVNRALAEGHAAVRLSGVADAAAAALPAARYAEVERRIAVLCRTRPVSALCQYEESSTVGEQLSSVASTHITGIRQRMLCTSSRSRDLSLGGDVDLSNEDLLAGVLRAATAGRHGTFTLHLNHLRFLSAGGCRVLATATAAFRDRGGLLLIVDPQPQVEHVLRLTVVDHLTGVELRGGPP